MGRLFSCVPVIFILGLLAFVGPADAQIGFSLDLGGGNDNEPVEFNLGDRTTGETYGINLEAVNENCEVPQDFRFDLSQIPWMYPESTDTVRGLRAGESGTIDVIIDFSNVSPGQYSGQATVHCATCQVLIFNTCNIDRRVLNFDVNVEPIEIPPMQPDPIEGLTVDGLEGDDTVMVEDPNSSQPETSGQQAGIEGIEIREPIDGGIEQGGQPDNQTDGRADAGPEGQGNTQTQQPESTDQVDQTDPPEPTDPGDDGYEVEWEDTDQFDPDMPSGNVLPDMGPGAGPGPDDVSTPATQAAWAGYEAAVQRKNDCEDELAALRAAAQAATDRAAAADAEADAAEAALAALEQDLMNRRAELTETTRAMDAAYRRIEGLAEYRSIVRSEDGTGSQRYQEADQQVNDANDQLEELQRQFSEHRQAIEQLQSQIETARAEAEAARAAANEAQAEADAAANALSEKERECLGLQQQEEEERADAERVQQAANDAAAEAERQRQQQIAAQQAAEEAAEVERQRLAVQRCEDCREAIRRYAQLLDKTFGAMRDIGMLSSGSESANDVNLEQIVAANYIQTLAESCAEIISLPTFEVFTALDALEAAYGLVAIRQLQLTPNTRGYLGDEYLANWLVEHGHADNPREANEMVREITTFREHNGNTQYIKDRFERMMRDCNRICCER